ncbi:MAG: DNA modification methylase [Phycisphaeraceae bacterium]|nr:DNA modification methylase [Phycisphaeraceae bacterium]
MAKVRSKNITRTEVKQEASPMQLRRVAIPALTPAPYNPRVELTPSHPTFEKLRRSIETFGTVEPIVWNRRTGHVVGGHQRLSVLKHLGHTHVDVVVVDLDVPQEKTLNLALNRIVGDWDEGKLAELLQDLTTDPALDIGLTGFDSAEIDHVLASVTTTEGLANDDSAFDVAANLQAAKPAVTKPGELIQLGGHRLLCGDCTIVADVQRLMDGQRAVLFATDPPYLVDYDGTNHPGTKQPGTKQPGPHQRVTKAANGVELAARSAVMPSGAALPSMRAASTTKPRSRPTKNKDWSGTYGVTWDDADGNSDLYDKFIEVAVAHAIAPNAAWYCWHASKRQAMVEATWQKHGAFVHCQIIWAKNRPVLTRTWYAWQHEPCLMGWIQGNKPLRAERNVLSTVWHIDTIPNGAERPDHPTPKPLEVFEIPMRQHTRAGDVGGRGGRDGGGRGGGRGDICYEPFAGSGTQIIAAEKLGRRCFAIEISPHYCDVIVRRWIHTVGPAKAPPDLVKRYAIKPSQTDGRKPAGKAVPA